MRRPQLDRLRVLGQGVDSGVDAFRSLTAPYWLWWDSEKGTGKFVRRVLPVLLLCLIVVFYLWVFIRLSWLRHENLGSFDYDLGMYDQGIWQLAHGRGFMTVRGMHVFAHHANLGYLLLVPFYWLGAGPQFLDIINVLGVTAVALPVFFLAKRHLRSEWAGLFLAATYLFAFSPQWKIQETFHAESLAAPFIVGAFYFATVGKWRWYGLCLVAAIIWKEDVAIVVAMMGLIVILAFGKWKIGLGTFLAGTAYFLVATKWFMPLYQQNGAVFDGLFAPLGNTATDVLRTAVREPERVGGVLIEHDADRNAFKLAAPGGLVALGSPMMLLLGLPQHLINHATNAYFTWDLRWHYAFFPYLSVMLAQVRFVIMRARMLTAWLLIAVISVSTAATQESGVGCWTQNGNAGNFPYAGQTQPNEGWGARCRWILFGGDDLTNIPANKAFYAAMARIPDDAVVSTTYYGVPHLSHRQFIYTFPNPWQSSNYGVGGIPAPPDPATVDYLLLRRDPLTPELQQLFDQILNSGDYNVEVHDGDLYLLHRKVPGPKPVVPTG